MTAQEERNYFRMLTDPYITMDDLDIENEIWEGYPNIYPFRFYDFELGVGLEWVKCAAFIFLNTSHLYQCEKIKLINNAFDFFKGEKVTEEMVKRLKARGTETFEDCRLDIVNSVFHLVMAFKYSQIIVRNGFVEGIYTIDAVRNFAKLDDKEKFIDDKATNNHTYLSGEGDCPPDALYSSDEIVFYDMILDGPKADRISSANFYAFLETMTALMLKYYRREKELGWESYSVVPNENFIKDLAFVAVKDRYDAEIQRIMRNLNGKNGIQERNLIDKITINGSDVSEKQTLTFSMIDLKKYF